MTLFVLIHGAYHGGWCWDLLGRELDAAGHQWLAPDLPCEEPVGASDYAAIVLREVLARNGEDVVVVGHSLGGLTAPLVADALGADQLVFLAAVVPEPGVASARAAFPPTMGDLWRERAAHQIVEDGLVRWPAEDAIDVFFHDCPQAVASWAAEQLRPQAFALLQEPCPLEALPRTDCRYIACAEDRTMTFEWQQQAARRLGVTPTVIAGGHSPFLARPKELAQLLMT
ncbi:MAG TPA: alpha/beta hydrolase [Jatrophihabitans sp.]|jgi:pimeloyl-ACP methyl ester carboxylesterase